MDILPGLLLAINLAGPGSQPVLGFANCSPALFRLLPAGQATVTISKVGYDSFKDYVYETINLKFEHSLEHFHLVSVECDPGAATHPKNRPCANFKTIPKRQCL